jgi:peptide/nickel transport system ATP-binding protein
MQADMTTEANVVDVRGLRVELPSSGVEIVSEISFDVRPGRVLGLVGESGSGKTTVGMALLGHCRAGAAVTDGVVRVGGRDLAGMTRAELRRLRGATISYIPQDPGTSLNPALRVGLQLEEMFTFHVPDATGQERRERAREVLREVALPDTDEFMRRYPHQLSGGQQQRIAIAMAFACKPRAIVCDEPTTGLDVTTEAHVLNTLKELCAVHHVAAVYVSHNLAVVADVADDIAVMYAGRIVEWGSREAIFKTPRHPYTRRLLRAVPDIEGRQVVTGIPGRAPLPGERPRGCFFEPRCLRATDECREEFPAVSEIAPGHTLRCFHPADDITDPFAASAPSSGAVHVR